LTGHFKAGRLLSGELRPRAGDNGQIVEENLFYDLVTFMRQLGLSG